LTRVLFDPSQIEKKLKNVAFLGEIF